MRAFFQALEKMLANVMRRLHALALQFARRSRRVEGKRTQPEDRPAPTAPVQSTPSPEAGLVGVPPSVSAAAAAEDAFAQSFGPETGAARDVSSHGEGRHDVVLPEAERGESARVQPADHVAVGVAAIERERAGPKAEVPTSEESPPNKPAQAASHESQPIQDAAEQQLPAQGAPHEGVTSPPREKLGDDAGTMPARVEAAHRDAAAAEIEPRPAAASPGSAELPSINAVEAEKVVAGEAVSETPDPKKPVQPLEHLPAPTSETPPSESEAAGDAGTRDGSKAERRTQDRPRPSRPSQESYEQPFVDPSLRPPSKEYAVWNKAVVQHCLLADDAKDQEVYLTISPRVLAGALSEVVDVILAPEEAEARFGDAVSEMYRTRVLPHPRKLEVLRRCGGEGLPECAAFLALSVLAAYRMHTDEGAAANAYYKRLDELLLCGLSGGLPRGFDPDEFESLWLFLRTWLDREHGRQMAMPGPDVGLRRYVALPLTHVPLRQVDIERLPDFFDWAGYEAGERVPIERIDADLSKWARVRDALTNAGIDALGDERRRAVLAQIAHELECWDGSHTDTQGRRTAPIEVFLHWERRIPLLSYLPRRPAAFPAVFNDGMRVFDAGQDGWYEPLPIGVEDGPELQSGFSWEAASNGIRIVLRRLGASAIAMAPSEFAGPVSHNGLLLGALGAALCQDALVVPAQQYLESVTGKRCAPAQLPTMPIGWTLFTGINPVRLLPPPDGLEALDIVTNPQIIPQGGLRLGRRWAWLAEAPPKLLVAGFDPSERAAIDGEPVEVDHRGMVRDEGRLTRPGVRVVEIGRVRRRLEIVDPEVAVAGFPDGVASDANRWRVAALPRGSWTVIGSCPDDAAYAFSKGWGQGALAYCPFDPVWAISYGCGRGAVVLCLVEQPPPPDRLPRLHARLLPRMQAWAEAVYNANIRRPAFRSPWGTVHRRDIPAVWAGYARTAREIKRRLRAERT